MYIVSLPILKLIHKLLDNIQNISTAQHNSIVILGQYDCFFKVLNEHPDFANGTNLPSYVNSTMPDFTVVRQMDKRTVLVLDNSGSMGGQRLDKLNQVK